MRHVLILDATYSCNDRCSFCFNKNKINSAPELTLEEIKKNYDYLSEKYTINQIIISGGEPTLHREFWQLMDFLYQSRKINISLNTNSLLFSNKKFVERYAKLLKKFEHPNGMFSLSLSSVDHYPTKNTVEKIKITGVKNVLKLAWGFDIETLVIITITKTNYRAIPALVKMLIKHYHQNKSKKKPLKFTIMLRGLYLGNFMDSKQKTATVPPDYAKIKPFVSKAVESLAKETEIKKSFFSLPLCYFKDSKYFPLLVSKISHQQKELRAKLNYELQFSKVKFSGFHDDSWELPECKGCFFETQCNKIQPEFLQNYGYPKPTPF